MEPTLLDQSVAWTTLITNVIAILTFLFAIKPIVLWAQSIKEQLLEVRRRLEVGPDEAFEDIRYQFRQVRLVDRTPNHLGRWKIAWSDQAGTHEEYASVSSGALRRKLSAGSDLLVQKPLVADLRLFRTGHDTSQPKEVEITRLYYVEGNRLAVTFYRIGRFVSGLFPPY